MSQEQEKRSGTGEESSPKHQNERAGEQTEREDRIIPAIRHVGKTLESDPEYYALASPGYSTPEAQIAAEAGHVDADQRQIQEDDFDSLAGRTLEDHPEKLKTRLAGDHSSDPHTDVGPDNATNLQDQPDIARSSKTDRA